MRFEFLNLFLCNHVGRNRKLQWKWNGDSNLHTLYRPLFHVTQLTTVCLNGITSICVHYFFSLGLSYCTWTRPDCIINSLVTNKWLKLESRKLANVLFIYLQINCHWQKSELWIDLLNTSHIMPKNRIQRLWAQLKLIQKVE